MEPYLSTAILTWICRPTAGIAGQGLPGVLGLAEAFVELHGGRVRGIEQPYLHLWSFFPPWPRRGIP